MNNLFEKFIYFILSFNDKFSQCKPSSHTNKTSKTFISANAHLTLNIETQKNIELVRKYVDDIVRVNKNDPNKILELVETKGTKVYKIMNAVKLLNIIGEQEGFIPEIRGIRALIFNLVVLSKLSFKTEPLFIFNDGELNLVSVVYSFYKWYSFKSNLPGFEYETQQNLKKYLLNVGNTSLLPIEDVLDLQEAINRDKEATEYALHIAHETEGANKVKKKITEGGANI